MNDHITIKKLRISCIIGCNPEERVKQQEVLVTTRLSCDCSKAGRSDRLEDTINYAKLSEQFIRIATEGQFNLIETLAERIAAFCLEDPRVSQVEVTIEKPAAIPQADYAAVTITREQSLIRN